MKKSAPVPPIEIRVDRSTPLARQLPGRLRELIAHARLRAGTRMPASRTLARRLGVSRNTILLAYEQLSAEEWLRGKTGSGTTVERGVRVVEFPDPDGLTLHCLARSRGAARRDGTAC